MKLLPPVSPDRRHCAGPTSQPSTSPPRPAHSARLGRSSLPAVPRPVQRKPRGSPLGDPQLFTTSVRFQSFLRSARTIFLMSGNGVSAAASVGFLGDVGTPVRFELVPALVSPLNRDTPIPSSKLMSANRCPVPWPIVANCSAYCSGEGGRPSKWEPLGRGHHKNRLTTVHRSPLASKHHGHAPPEIWTPRPPANTPNPDGNVRTSESYPSIRSLFSVRLSEAPA